MPTTITGKQIRQSLVNLSWCFLGTSTDNGSTDFLVDTARLKGANLPGSLFDNGIVRISSGPLAGNKVYVDRLDPLNGKLYVTPTLSQAIPSGTEYEVWLRGIDPDIADRIRDDALESMCSTWRINPITVIPNGDLQDDDGWTGVSGATVSIAFPSISDAFWRRELVVNHPTSAAYAESDDIFVNPNERFMLQVPVRAYVNGTYNPATATIVVRDYTNNVNVPIGGLKTQQTGPGLGWISLLFTIPSGCYRIRLRLHTNSDNSSTIWGPFACHRRQKTRHILPARIRSRNRVGNVFIMSNINPATSEQANFYYKFSTIAVERVQVGSQVELGFSPPLSEYGVYYYERGFYKRLQTDYYTVSGRVAGDAAVTDCPKEYIVATLAERLSKYMLDMTNSPQWQDDWVRNSSELNHWEREFGAEPRYVMDQQTPIGVFTLRI
jgi:hypothetical protein